VSSERIKLIRKSLKMNQALFADYLGVTPSTVSEIESGSRDPSKNLLISLGEKGFSIDWILTGSGDMYKLKNELFDGKNFPAKGEKFSLQNLSNGLSIDTAPQEGGGPGSTDVKERTMTNVVERTETLTVKDLSRKQVPVVVQEYGEEERGLLIPVINQRASAGLGFDYDDGEVSRFVKVPAWLARRSNYLVAVPVYGDSMDPTIANGDLAICAESGFRGDGLYVVRDEDRGLTFCKRVLWAPGGWTLRSDNPNYGPVNVDDKSINVVARVIAAVKEVK